MALDYNALTQATNLLLQPQVQKHEILTVNSYQEAKDFKINKGDSYLLLDPNADLLYIRECDTIGKNSTRVFKLAEITDDFVSQNTGAIISKAEYEALLQRVMQLENKNTRRKSDAVNEQQTAE